MACWTRTIFLSRILCDKLICLGGSESAWCSLRGFLLFLDLLADFAADKVSLCVRTSSAMFADKVSFSGDPLMLWSFVDFDNATDNEVVAIFWGWEEWSFFGVLTLTFRYLAGGLIIKTARETFSPLLTSLKICPIGSNSVTTGADCFSFPSLPTRESQLPASVSVGSVPVALLLVGSVSSFVAASVLAAVLSNFPTLTSASVSGMEASFFEGSGWVCFIWAARTWHMCL